MTAPPSRCPRCAQRTPQRAASVCATCGLRMACPQCGERYESPLEQQFCTTCGTVVEQPAWDPPPNPPDDEPQPATAARAARGARAPGASGGGHGGLFTSLEPPAAISTLGQRARRRGVRTVRRTIRKSVMGTLGELYQQLGEALMEHERFEEA